MSDQLNLEAERAAFDEEACRKTCDICFDEVGNVWPCARKRAFARRTVDTPEFHELLGKFRSCGIMSTEDVANEIIAYIDGRSAGVSK